MPSLLPKTERAATRDQARELRSWGWHETPEGWRHKAVHFPWPHRDALRLMLEALDGGMDCVHRALRGEE